MAKTTKTAQPDSTLSQVQELYRFMVEQKLETLEYDHQGLHIRLVRQRPATFQVPAPVPLVMHHPGAAAAPVAGAMAAPAAPQLPPNGTTIKAPMMGIFYVASSPSSPPFVKPGDVVKRGQVICLIEAMKVFNEIKADFDFVVDTVLHENGKPVKANQDLYVVTRK